MGVVRLSPTEDGPAPSSRAPEEARFKALVADHFDFVWRQLRRHGLTAPDADDATQQVFMIASQKLDSIEAGNERGFLYGTARRVASNARRGTSRRREIGGDDPDLRQALASPADELADAGRALTLLDELLARMPGELARVLALAEIEELSVAEIARLEEIPAGTAASRLRRAREEFRSLLKTVYDRNPFAGGSG